MNLKKYLARAYIKRECEPDCNTSSTTKGGPPSPAGEGTLSVCHFAKSFGFLSGNMIKILAAALMVCDHIGVVLGHEDSILRILGRISMPLFAFMIAEGAK